MLEALFIAFAKEAIPAIFRAIVAGDAERAAWLARGAAHRVALRKAAEKTL